MQSLLFRGTSRHTVEHLLVVGQNCHTTWNASEFIDLHSCFCRLLVVKLIFRLLTEHSVFLLPYIYCGSFNVSKQRNFGADTQFTVSPIAWWRIDCADLEVFLTKIYCVFYQSFSQPSWETALFFFFLFSRSFFSVCCFFPSKKWNQKQAAHPNMRTYYFCTDTAKEMESWMKVMTDAALVQAETVKRFVEVLSLWHAKRKYSVRSFELKKKWMLALSLAPMCHISHVSLSCNCIYCLFEFISAALSFFVLNASPSLSD